MFLRKYWLPVSVFLVAICAVGLYLLATQPPKDANRVYKAVEPTEKPTQQPTTQAPVGDTSQGGHIHADVTWHEVPHEPVAETPPAAVPSLSDAELAAIPENMPKPDIPLPTDLKNMDWKEWSKKHHREWLKYIHALDPAIERISKEIEAFGNLPPESSPDYAAAKAKWDAKILEQNRLINEQGWRIVDSDAERDEAFEKYYLARFGRKPYE